MPRWRLTEASDGDGALTCVSLHARSRLRAARTPVSLHGSRRTVGLWGSRPMSICSMRSSPHSYKSLQETLLLRDAELWYTTDIVNVRPEALPHTAAMVEMMTRLGLDDGQGASCAVQNHPRFGGWVSVTSPLVTRFQSVGSHACSQRPERLRCQSVRRMLFLVHNRMHL